MQNNFLKIQCNFSHDIFQLLNSALLFIVQNHFQFGYCEVSTNIFIS
jgi:hypothetical protein